MPRTLKKPSPRAAAAKRNVASPSRELALDVLAEVRAGRFAEHALSERLEATRIGSKDRALATELTYGVLRWRMRMDAIIDRCLRKSRSKLRPHVRDILRIALYQLIMLDRIPEHAAVNQAVMQARRRCDERAAGFVNALLRNVIRTRESVDPRPSNDAESLSCYYSHPVWLVKRWLDELGLQATLAILAHNNSRSTLTVRVNSLKTTREDFMALLASHEIAAQPAHTQPNAVVISPGAGAVHELPGFHEGLFVVQECASQMIAPLLRVQPGVRVLDACAAPGGKTAHLAALGGNRILITAIDSDASRVEETRRNLERLGVTCADVVQGDSTDASFVEGLGPFDAVLLDPPCSNLGVLRHNPEVKYRIGPDDPSTFARVQSNMVRATAGALKPGGTLVYSVCTVTYEETVQVVTDFLKEFPQFSAARIQPGEVGSPRLLDPTGFLTTFPPRAEEPLDGFFAARTAKT